MASKKFAFFLLSAVVFSTAVAAKRPGFGGNSTEFIRACCGATRYPRLCFTSMAGYSSAVQESPVQVAQLATNLTLARIGDLARRVKLLRRGASGRVAAALADCTEVLGDAADQARRTAAELKGLEAAKGPEVAWRVSNAQTWMSAALTNEDTCTDGFDGVGSCPVKAEVGRQVLRVKQFTSNALALVNNLVASR
ncbi:21 kDa protein-like [Phoenix dactylifera]|uniref:21 kDa protein-like n=1 Tax=Phoenix dactylifera TaxID=42345 RepID=A0A8B7BFD2_PHODC|nr:21 kDa protein-like [Phoenix dactylifera]